MRSCHVVFLRVSVYLKIFIKRGIYSGETKNLIDGFYLTRKDRGTLASAYSYECKVCTVRRIVETRKKQEPHTDWIYPDW